MAASNMKAVYYSAPRQLETRYVPIPTISDDEVLIKVSCCGVCTVDNHLHRGEFISKFPLIPGHEVTGTIICLGKNVHGFAEGDRCVADPGVTCDTCFYCRRGQGILCENFNGVGFTSDGGYAEYVVFDGKKVHKIHNLTDEEAIMIEPTACAVHGMDKLNAAVGVEALVIGAGPIGLILAQLLKVNGATNVVIAANKGIKTKIAKDLEAGDQYVELDRENPAPQWEQIKREYPYGFDVVIEATGSESVANDSINYVRRGGTLMIYGVYPNEARVYWPPSKILGDEIKIVSSFGHLHCFPRAVAYLESGKINVKGMVTNVFKIEQYQEALDKMNSRAALKIAVVP